MKDWAVLFKLLDMAAYFASVSQQKTEHALRECNDWVTCGHLSAALHDAKSLHKFLLRIRADVKEAAEKKPCEQDGDEPSY